MTVAAVIAVAGCGDAKRPSEVSSPPTSQPTPAPAAAPPIGTEVRVRAAD
jgi:hypothetical protein